MSVWLETDVWMFALFAQQGQEAIDYIIGLISVTFNFHLSHTNMLQLLSIFISQHLAVSSSSFFFLPQLLWTSSCLHDVFLHFIKLDENRARFYHHWPYTALCPTPLTSKVIYFCPRAAWTSLNVNKTVSSSLISLNARFRFHIMCPSTTADLKSKHYLNSCLGYCYETRDLLHPLNVKNARYDQNFSLKH